MNWEGRKDGPIYKVKTWRERDFMMTSLKELCFVNTMVSSVERRAS